ncbi:uncharacterized protein LOC144876588 [Branchiostoma floridae x Branchiostoma japonicum]
MRNTSETPKMATVDSSTTSSSHSHDTGSGHGDKEPCCGAVQCKDGKVEPVDIFYAAKLGMLIPCQEFIEHLGTAVLHTCDEKGHTPLHWAALGGHTAVVRYFIDCKAPLDKQSENKLGPRPIHWACVRGHVGIVDLLLQQGVPIDTPDSKGCTPLILACQYGQTIVAAYLMSKGARLQMLDHEGDNALHWACFKGQAELVRLLIFSGFNPRQRDNYGQTPLHLACINGNLNIVKELVEEDDVEVDLEDKNGKTPLMLAIGRKHHSIEAYLKNRLERKRTILGSMPKFDWSTLLWGPPGNSKGALLFFICSVLFWGYPMYIFKVLPYTLQEMQALHLLFFLDNCLMWYFLYKASTTEPGYLPRDTEEYHNSIRQAAHFDEWQAGANPLTRLCHTCRLVKPLRSKHCRVCNRCVDCFDHHCPYIYNCVGFRNRGAFLCFVTSTLTVMWISIYLVWGVLSEQGWDILMLIGFLELVFFSFIALAVSGMAWYMVAMNITTNERLNMKRYEYLKDGNGRFYNPFMRTMKDNCMEYFHMKKPLSEVEVEFMSARVNIV